jgi:hypothetical protein
MHWRDFQPAPGVGPWQGLDLTIAAGDLPPGAPGWRIEAATPGRIRIACAGVPALWARVHRWHYGLWRFLPPRAASWEIVPPIRVRDLATIKDAPGTEAWWRAWARWMAQALAASPRTPLHPGRWALTAARAADLRAPQLPGPPPVDWTALAAIEDVRACLDAPALAWESWCLSGSGALLRTRDPSPPGGARVRAWIKRAREGRLPPLLAVLVSGLDMFVLLDGHDRLRAAVLEGIAPVFLVLWHIRATPQRPDPARQAAVVREIERKRALRSGRRPLDTERENRLLVSAFDDRDWLWPRSRARPLPGSAAAWDEEVARVTQLPRDHGLFSGEAPPR